MEKIALIKLNLIHSGSLESEIYTDVYEWIKKITGSNFTHNEFVFLLNKKIYKLAQMKEMIDNNDNEFKSFIISNS